MCIGRCTQVVCSSVLDLFAAVWLADLGFCATGMPLMATAVSLPVLEAVWYCITSVVRGPVVCCS